jgi:hypothetical protein
MLWASILTTNSNAIATFNPKNKGRRLHRHPAFFGTVEECLEDCCEVILHLRIWIRILIRSSQHCPKPIDNDEKKLQEEEDELFIRGRIK